MCFKKVLDLGPVVLVKDLFEDIPFINNYHTTLTNNLSTCEMSQTGDF